MPAMAWVRQLSLAQSTLITSWSILLTGEIVERRVGDKRVAIQAMSGGGTQRIEQATQFNEACLTDEQIRALG